jgi:hypothetical protein
MCYVLKKGKKSCNRTLNGKKEGEGRMQIKTKHSTAQIIRNTKKKSDSGYNGITALYKFSDICSVVSSHYDLLGYETMQYCTSITFQRNMLPSSGLMSAWLRNSQAI